MSESPKSIVSLMQLAEKKLREFDNTLFNTLVNQLPTIFEVIRNNGDCK